MKLIINGRDFTSLCVGLALEDNIYSSAASLTAQIVFENHDGYLPPVFAYCGDEVTLEDGDVIFRGSIIRVEVNGKAGCFMVNAVEKSHLLSKNDVYGIFSSNAAQNARKAIESVGLTAGRLEGKTCRGFASYGGMTAKEVIDASYGDGYFVRCDGDAVSIMRAGSEEIGLNGSMIFDIRSVESVENMVNKVSLTNSKNRVIYNTESYEDVRKYGKYHKYRQITRNQSASAVAKEMLEGIRKTAKLQMGGQFKLRKGWAVSFDLERYGLVGRYVIESVRHRVADGVHTTEIEVKHESLL